MDQIFLPLKGGDRANSENFVPLPQPSVFCHSASRASAIQRIPKISLTFERKRIPTNLLEIETTVQPNTNTVIKKKGKRQHHLIRT